MLEVRDPADVRSVVAEVPAMTATEVAAAYDRARAAFETWRRVNPLDRASVLGRAADLIRSGTEEGAVTLVRENGKTLAEARVEVTKTADFLDYYASFARQPWGELLADEAETVKLRELERRSLANGVPGVRWLSGAELRELEPHVAGVAALLSPATASMAIAEHIVAELQLPLGKER